MCFQLAKNQIQFKKFHSNKKKLNTFFLGTILLWIEIFANKLPTLINKKTEYCYYSLGKKIDSITN